MKLNRLTITGADDDVSIVDMFQLSAIYPFLEWGILLSSRKEGTPRYPSRAWCGRLALNIRHNPFHYGALPISLHLCGGLAEDAYAGIFNGGPGCSLDSYAGRFQINGKPPDPGVFNFSTKPRARRIIYQIPNGAPAASAATALRANPELLYDASGGEGIEPSTWPWPTSGNYCGFAGGLNPENFERHITYLLSNRDPNPRGKVDFWMDVETGVRTDNKLDFAKVEAMAKIAFRYVA